MAKIGRLLLVQKNNVTIAGLQNSTISWGGESIDITTGEDAGKRLLLAESAQEQLDISFEGITKALVFQDIALGTGSKMLTDIEIEMPVIGSGTTGAKITGNFRLSSFETSGEYKDAIKFSGTLESSGAWTYTAQV